MDSLLLFVLKILMKSRHLSSRGVTGVSLKIVVILHGSNRQNLSGLLELGKFTCSIFSSFGQLLFNVKNEVNYHYAIAKFTLAVFRKPNYIIPYTDTTISAT